MRAVDAQTRASAGIGHFVADAMELTEPAEFAVSASYVALASAAAAAAAPV